MNDLTKLPKWAQTHIRDIARQRDDAVRSLNEFVDSQTESEISYDDSVNTGESAGPSNKTEYINGANTITFRHAGIELDVCIYPKDCIRLSYSKIGRGFYDIAFLPVASNVMVMKTAENMS